MAWADEIKKRAQEYTQEKQQNSNMQPNSKDKDNTTQPNQTGTTGEQYQNGVMTQRADGTLTDYGKSLRTQLEAQNISSTYKAPTGFNAEKGLYGGLTPTYEAYVAANVPLGNKVVSRDQWAQSIASSNEKDANKIREALGNSYQAPTGMGSISGSTTNYLGNVSNTTGGTNQYGVTDNSSLISQSYEAQKTAAVEALKNAIAKAKGTYQATIKEAPSTFAPLKNETTVAANQQLTRLRESMAEQGQAGGVSRSEETAVSSARENQLNALNQQEQKIISDATSAISQLEADGQFQEAQIVANNANEKLRALIEESNRVEQETYSRKTAQDAIAREAQQIADQRAYEQQQLAQQQAYQQQQTASERAYAEQQNKAQQDREDYLMNIGQFSQNYQKEINNLLAQGVPETDYRVMALRNARTQKLGAMAEAEQNAYVQAMADEQARQEQAFELAKWRFESGLPATQMDSQLLGVPVGQVSPAQVIKQAELQLQKQKENRISSNTTAKTKKSPVTLTDYEQALKATFNDTDTAETKAKKAAQYIVNNKDVISNDIIQRLATRYGVTEQMIQDYINIEKFNVMKNL